MEELRSYVLSVANFDALFLARFPPMCVFQSPRQAREDSTPHPQLPLQIPSF